MNCRTCGSMQICLRINYIDSKSIWLGIINSKHIEIFCTDMSLAEEVVKDTAIEYTIYNVEKNT